MTRSNEQSALQECNLRETWLALQGGGAIGAYEVGVLDGMERFYRRTNRNLLLNGVAGISIGTINAAVIVGNKPENRLPQLRRLWSKFASPAWLPNLPWFGPMNHWLGVTQAIFAGQNGFFEPRWNPARGRFTNPFFASPGTKEATSFYSTDELRKTLLEFVDFDLINSGDTRLLLGVVNNSTGHTHVFDNAVDKIGPEHVMASGALPPAFPAVEIDGEQYWDGGVGQNNPMQMILSRAKCNNKLIIDVSLFNACGPSPVDMVTVGSRLKNIRFSAPHLRAKGKRMEFQRMSRDLARLLEHVPAELRSEPWFQAMQKEARHDEVELLELMYVPQPWETEFADTDFGLPSLDTRMEQGARDALEGLDQFFSAGSSSPARGSRRHRFTAA